MIRKQHLWYILLFSIILVLSIIYIGMDNEDVNSLTNFSNDNNNNETQLVLNESSILVALRVQSDEEMEDKLNEYKEILLSDVATLEEKNDAYDNLLLLNENKGIESKLEDLIKKEFNLESFVKINTNSINVVINKEEHSYELANSIIKTVQSNFKEDKYITVKFN